MSWALLIDVPPSKEEQKKIALRKQKGGDWVYDKPGCRQCRTNDYNPLALSYVGIAVFLLFIGLIFRNPEFFILTLFFSSFLVGVVFLVGFQDAARRGGSILIEGGRPRHECTGYCARWKYNDGTFEDDKSS